MTAKGHSMMEISAFKIGAIPAVLYGDKSNQLYLFVHGKCGCKEEAADFAEIACPKGWQVLAIDLPEHGERNGEAGFDPWHVVPELQSVMEYTRLRWSHIALRATSLGAWFSMLAFEKEPLKKALFVSPVLDMEKLIHSMMLWANVSEEQLQKEQEIATDFGETLSWRYLQYTKTLPIVTWKASTAILYAGKDNLTDRATVDEFVRRFDCELTVMADGEHWFHTPEQLEVLNRWAASVMMGDSDKRVLLSNLHQLHTTDLGVERITRNLSLLMDDVVGWCKEQIQHPDASILRRGKNWYVNIADCEITVNAYSYTIITAHRR